MLRHKLIAVMALVSSAFFSQLSHAAFPTDFSDVIWIDPNISSWPVTASVTANVSGSSLVINDTKRNVWPKRFHTDLQSDCCNRSLWIFVKNEGQWYAATFEYMRLGQVNKNAEAVNGQQIKRAPFFGGGTRWEPAEGEVYGFMTSGMARFNLNNNNVQERSNVALYRWGVGPTDNVNFTEVPRGPDGLPIEGEPEPEECVEPEAPAIVNATHTFSGPAQGQLVVTGAINQTADFASTVSITVKDDRSLSFSIEGETFNTTVAQDGSYSGVFDLSFVGGLCQVSVNVNGSVTGTTSSGTAQGNGSCSGSQAVFNATFNATSATAPSYIDQRSGTPTPRSVCGTTPPLSSIINLLID